jgi:hypothetical protein
MPRRAFGVSLVVSEFANALGWDAHGPSITGLDERRETLAQAGSNPSPVTLRLANAPERDTLSPGRGPFIRFVDSRRLTGMTGFHDTGAWSKIVSVAGS